MKHHIYFFAMFTAMLLMATGIFAQQSKNAENSKLEGVWQLCTSYIDQPDGSVQVRTGNVFKILGSNGELTNILFNDKEGKSLITVQGYYNLTSDSTYVEDVRKSTNSLLIGKKNELNYKVKNGKYLVVKFYVEQYAEDGSADEYFEETWVKVDMPKDTSDAVGKTL